MKIRYYYYNKSRETIEKKELISEDEVWKCLIHVSYALKCLHEMQVFHRDIKSANIFIVNNIYKLADLNVSKESIKGLAYTQTGTPFYASPEVWRDEPYDYKSDIWSLGCLIYEMCNHQPPFQVYSFINTHTYINTLI
jgi:NIMA (never in mitosis gene a)-related kinase